MFECYESLTIFNHQMSNEDVSRTSKGPFMLIIMIITRLANIFVLSRDCVSTCELLYGSIMALRIEQQSHGVAST